METGPPDLNAHAPHGPVVRRRGPSQLERESPQTSFAGKSARAQLEILQRGRCPHLPLDARADHERVHVPGAPDVRGGEHPETSTQPGREISGAREEELQRGNREQEQTREG